MFERFIDLVRLANARFRAYSWSFRGATIAAKVGIGARCRVDIPAGIQMHTRVTLEEDVWLKLVNQNAKLEIGEFSFIGRGSEFDVAQSVSLGANVLIAPRVFVTDHAHKIDRGTPINQQGCDSQPVKIGNDVWIGTGATILNGVSIGDGAVIGAGALVRQDVPSNEIWAGVPARKIRDR